MPETSDKAGAGRGGLPQEEEQALRVRFESVLKRLRQAVDAAGRENGSVNLVAVSKWHPASSLEALARYWKELGGASGAWALPQERIIFSENYVQEAREKQAAIQSARTASVSGREEPDICWHFSGHLQSNKAKQAVRRFELLHTLDSLSLAQNLQKILDQQGRQGDLPLAQDVLVQVNIGAEAQKSGVLPQETPTFIKALQAFAAIRVKGLMCLPPVTERAEDSRPFFSALRQLRDRLEDETGQPLPHLSMGMSHDFEVAIEEGATLVRVGTDIFGERIRGASASPRR